MDGTGRKSTARCGSRRHGAEVDGTGRKVDDVIGITERLETQRLIPSSTAHNDAIDFRPVPSTSAPCRRLPHRAVDFRPVPSTSAPCRRCGASARGAARLREARREARGAGRGHRCDRTSRVALAKRASMRRWSCVTTSCCARTCACGRPQRAPRRVAQETETARETTSDGRLCGGLLQGPRARVEGMRATARATAAGRERLGASAAAVESVMDAVIPAVVSRRRPLQTVTGRHVQSKPNQTKTTRRGLTRGRRRPEEGAGNRRGASRWAPRAPPDLDFWRRVYDELVGHLAQELTSSYRAPRTGHVRATKTRSR